MKKDEPPMEDPRPDSLTTTESLVVLHTGVAKERLRQLLVLQCAQPVTDGLSRFCSS